MTTTTKQPKKNLSVVTYLIALVCLLLGLLLPFVKDANGDNKMLLLMIPSALGSIMGGNQTLMDIGVQFANSITIDFFGIVSLDVTALAILVYAVATVVGIIMLIPVFACKKKTPVSVCGYVVEVTAFIALFVYVFVTVGWYSCYYNSAAEFQEKFVFDWPIICVAFGGTLLMMIIQAIANYKGSGVLKIVVWLLGLVGIAALLNLPILTTMFKDTYGSMNGLFVSFSNTGLPGYYIGLYFLEETFGDGGIYLLALLGEASAVKTAASIALSVAIILAVVNFIIDTITLSAKTTKGGVVFDCVRYLLEVIAAVVGLVLLFVIDDYDAEPGILLYALVAVAVICAVISIIRSSVYKKTKDAKIPAQPATSYYQDDTIEEEKETVATPAPAPAAAPAPAPVYAAPAPAPATNNTVYIPIYPAPYPAYPAPNPYAPNPYAPNPYGAPAPAPAPQSNAQVVYKVKEVYNGPTDEFISRLTDTEKIEFAKLFIEKINGSYENVPDYIVGGDNKDFFSAIFIYLGKFRPLLSDGLMNKIYNELNLMN